MTRSSIRVNLLDLLPRAARCAAELFFMTFPAVCSEISFFIIFIPLFIDILAVLCYIIHGKLNKNNGKTRKKLAIL